MYCIVVYKKNNFGPYEVFACSTSSGHWGKNPCMLLVRYPVLKVHLWPCGENTTHSATRTKSLDMPGTGWISCQCGQNASHTYLLMCTRSDGPAERSQLFFFLSCSLNNVGWPLRFFMRAGPHLGSVSICLSCRSTISAPGCTGWNP